MQKFTKYLLIAMTGINILAVIATCLEFSHSYRAAQERSQAEAGNLAASLGGYLGHMVGRADLVLKNSVNQIEQHYKGNLYAGEPLYRFVLTQRTLIPEADQLFAAAPNGDIPEYVNGKTIIATNIADREYFARARAAKDSQTIIGLPVTSRRTNQIIMPLARRITSADGEFAGVVGITIPQKQISETLSHLNLPPHGEVLVVDPKFGVMIRHAHDQQALVPANFETLLNAIRALPADVHATTLTATTAGVERLVSIHRVEGYPLYVAVGLSTAQIHAHWVKEASTTFILLAAFILMSVLMTRAILNSVARQRAINAQLLAREDMLRKLQLAVEQSPTSIAITNTAGEIEFINEAFTKASGYTFDEVRGKTPRILQSGETSPETYRELWNTLRSGNIWRGELTNRRKDGSIYIENETLAPLRQPDGSISHYLAIKSDVTDSKRIHQQLDSLGRDLQGVLDAAFEISIIATDPNGLISVFNRGAERMLGYRADEMVGLQTPAIIHLREEVEERGKELTRHFGKPIEGFRVFVEVAEKEGSEHREWTYVTKAGGHLVVSLVVTAIRNADGSISGYLGIAQDISERKQAEIELVRAAQAAAEANRAKSQFLANMSHEIRTPMNGVIGMTQLLQMTELSQDQREYANTIRDSAESLLTLINDILDFSKVEAGKLAIEFTGFSLRAMLQQMRDLFSSQVAPKGLYYEESIAESVPDQLIGDPGRLRQILTNLIGNAIKFTERGGVRVIIHCQDRTDDGAWITFTVSDTGIGIDDATRQRLFSPFYQADASTTRRFGGTGLGLSISHRLAELMGGTIQVESSPGVGSHFRLQLPFALGNADDTAEPEVRPKETPAQIAHRTDMRILLVEDNPINQLVMQQMLRKLGLEAIVAANGSIALDLLRNTPFDLVFMDCQMPVMDGFEATRRIRNGEAGEARRSTRIVALTANAMKGDREACLAAGMDDYLAKPIILDDLIACLHVPPGSAPHTLVAQGAPSPAISVFSHAVLLEHTMRERDLAQVIATSTLDDIPNGLAAYDTAIAAGDFTSATRAIHTIKGLATQAGGGVLATRCRQLEQQLQEGTIPDATAREELGLCYRQFADALRAWLAET